jgi:predicted CxxxxCH...CXXCH cytochrome family protein
MAISTAISTAISREGQASAIWISPDVRHHSAAALPEVTFLHRLNSAATHNAIMCHGNASATAQTAQTPEWPSRQPELAVEILNSE